MLQFKVPQNIKMPDQIIGPLTVEQFLYLFFAFIIDYVIYLKIGYSNTYLVISIPIAMLAVAFAFVPVNEQPFSKFVQNLIIFLVRPRVLLWLQLPPDIFDVPQPKKIDIKKEKEEIMHPEEVKSQLQQLSLILDTRIAPPTPIKDLPPTPKTITLPPDIVKKNPTNKTSNIQEKISGAFSNLRNIFRKKFDQSKLAKKQQDKQEALSNILNTPGNIETDK